MPYDRSRSPAGTPTRQPRPPHRASEPGIYNIAARDASLGGAPPTPSSTCPRRSDVEERRRDEKGNTDFDLVRGEPAFGARPEAYSPAAALDGRLRGP